MNDKEKKMINGEEYIYSAEENRLFPMYETDERGNSYKMDEETFTYIPMLLANDDYEDYELGFYGNEREKFLKKNYGGYYLQLMGEFKLQPHLIEFDKKAKEEEQKLLNKYDENEITEELKNQIKESILNNIIYIK